MKLLILAVMIAVAAAAEYPKPPYPAPPAYPKAEEPPMPYNFAYAVKDEPSYLDFEQEANSDGKVATGSYRVALPDGRTQKVSYKDDGYSGYVAEVKYEGNAKYPPPAPAYPKAKAYPA